MHSGQFHVHHAVQICNPSPFEKPQAKFIVLKIEDLYFGWFNPVDIKVKQTIPFILYLQFLQPEITATLSAKLQKILKPKIYIQIDFRKKAHIFCAPCISRKLYRRRLLIQEVLLKKIRKVRYMNSCLVGDLS